MPIFWPVRVSEVDADDHVGADPTPRMPDVVGKGLTIRLDVQACSRCIDVSSLAMPHARAHRRKSRVTAQRIADSMMSYASRDPARKLFQWPAVIPGYP